jgi:hypothetical protein
MGILQMRAPVGGRWGQPGRLSHGDVVPGTDMQPECRAGLPVSLGGERLLTSKQHPRSPTRYVDSSRSGAVRQPTHRASLKWTQQTVSAVGPLSPKGVPTTVFHPGSSHGTPP